jgi:cation/acetate symporter
VSELFVSRVTTVVLGIVAVVLGIVFKRQNIAFMVSLAFAVVASANFPVLFVSVPWRGCTTRGAAIGGFLGLISAVLPTVLSKAVWVDVFQFCERAFSLVPYASPALFSMGWASSASGHAKTCLRASPISGATRNHYKSNRGCLLARR